MGADGGSFQDRRALVKTKKQAPVTDKALLRELFFLCALSKLYNKDAVLEYFIDKAKYGDGDQICGYLKSLKELLTLNLTPNPTYSPGSSSTTANTTTRAPFVCPLSLKEMSGAVPFIALRPCGCVFSDASIRAVIPNLTKGVAGPIIPKDQLPTEAEPLAGEDKHPKTAVCPNCGVTLDPTRSDSVLPINPTRDVQEVLLEHLLVSRAAAKSSKKRKAAKVDEIDVAPPKTTSNGLSNGAAAKLNGAEAPPSKTARTDSPAPPKRPTSHSASPVTVSSSMPRSVHQKLAEQEQKRLAAQAGMSDAVRSMFKPKEDEKRGGAADFFGRTFTRYAA